jgi:hypothetical protein
MGGGPTSLESTWVVRPVAGPVAEVGSAFGV